MAPLAPPGYATGWPVAQMLFFADGIPLSSNSLTTHHVKQRREDGKQREGARTATVNTIPANVQQRIQSVEHAADLAIGRQHAGANRQPMVPSQALRSQGDPAHNPGQGDEVINKPSTSCASMKTATMMTRSNTWNLTVSQTMTGEMRFLRLWISLCATGPESVLRL